MRGYDYLSFTGQQAFFLNAELRFPLIEAMATPIGILGGIRGAFFANVGGATWEGQSFKFMTRSPSIETPTIGYDDEHTDADADLRPSDAGRRASVWSTVARPTASVCRRSRSASPCTSTGRGRSLFNKNWEDVIFALDGGSAAFRKPKFSMWIGYDF